MNIRQSSIAEVWIAESSVHQDHRGAFSRLFCAEEEKSILGQRSIVQINHSLTRAAGVLEEDSELLYLHTAFYSPADEGAVRFDDPKIGVDWPLPPTDLSAKDSSHPYLDQGFEGISP